MSFSNVMIDTLWSQGSLSFILFLVSLSEPALLPVGPPPDVGRVGIFGLSSDSSFYWTEENVLIKLNV